MLLLSTYIFLLPHLPSILWYLHFYPFYCWLSLLFCNLYLCFIKFKLNRSMMSIEYLLLWYQYYTSVTFSKCKVECEPSMLTLILAPCYWYGEVVSFLESEVDPTPSTSVTVFYISETTMYICIIRILSSLFLGLSGSYYRPYKVLGGIILYVLPSSLACTVYYVCISFLLLPILLLLLISFLFSFTLRMLAYYLSFRAMTWLTYRRLD